MTDPRLRKAAEALDAGLIARREFLRRAAVVTGGTAVGLDVLKSMASAQAKPKLRVWLFKSFVTAGNDVLAKHIEAWAKERNVDVELDWATFGDREQKFVAAIEAGNPPDLAEMNVYGPMRYRPRSATSARSPARSPRRAAGSCRSPIERDEGRREVPRRAAVRHDTVFFVRKDIMEAKGLKPPKVYDPDVVEFARKTPGPRQGPLGVRPDTESLRRRRRVHGEHPLDYGGGVWDKDGKPALGTAFLKQNTAALQFAVDTIQKHKIQPPGVMGWTDVSNNEAYMAGKLVTTNNGASLYFAMVNRKHELAPRRCLILTPGGPAGSFVTSSCYNWEIFQKSKHAELAEDLIRWMEDEKRFEEYLQVSVGQAGPVYRARVDNPYWKSDPNFEAMLQNILKSVPLGHPGPITPAAAEVRGQKILTDMAGRVVVGGLTAEAALKEAHARVEEIHKIRSRG